MCAERILGVYVAGTNEAGIKMLEIQLNGGATLYYPLDEKPGGYKGSPQTDGQSVFWEDGAQISYAEIRTALESGLRRGKITKAEAVPDYPDEISVSLENGAVAVLSIDSKRDSPLFAEIKELALPKTDGSRVYWSNQASLAAEDILSLLFTG